MNGPAHYRTAETVLTYVTKAHDVAPETRDSMIAAAQVHATLALTAASVEDMESGVLRPGWAEILDGLDGS